MSSGAGQPISPTLSPEVQEVMADWAKTLEAPGANPGLLPMRGVGGDSRSRRRLEQHLRARHAEELGWFYGWKRFLAASRELGAFLVHDRRAESARALAPSFVLECSSKSLDDHSSALRLAQEACRWSPGAAYEIQLAFHMGDRKQIGGEREWWRASAGLSSRAARVDAWRADAAKLSFDAGDYLHAAGLYLTNSESRGSCVEACAAFVSALLADELNVARQAMGFLASAEGSEDAIQDYSIGLGALAPTLASLALRVRECGDSSVRQLASDILGRCSKRGISRERTE